MMKRAEYNKEWNEKNRERQKAYKTKYYEAHKKEILEKAKEYYDSLKNPCVYAYYDVKTNECAYVGSTNNIVQRTRVRKYKQDGELFTKIFQLREDQFKCKIIKFCDSIEEARKLEIEIIKELHPKYNIRYNNL